MGQTGDLQTFYGAECCCVGFSFSLQGLVQGAGGSERGSGGWEWSEHEREEAETEVGRGTSERGQGC